MANNQNKTPGFYSAGANKKYGFKTVPNESVSWRLQSADGTDFGDVSYAAYKAAENGNLNTYTPKNKAEETAIAAFRKHPSIPLTTKEGKTLGNISYDAYKAFTDNTINDYTPHSETEGNVISAFKAYAENAAKTERINSNPVFKRYNIDPADLNTKSGVAVLQKWADENNYKLSLNPTTMGFHFEPAFKGFTKLSSKQEDTDAEFLEKYWQNNMRKETAETDYGAFMAAGYGFVDGLTFGGINALDECLGKKLYVKAGGKEDDYVSMDRSWEKTVDSHKAANFIGNLAGSVLSTYATGAAVGSAMNSAKATALGVKITNAAKKVNWVAKSAPWIEAAVTDGITFGITNGTRTAFNGGTFEDVIKNALRGGVSGAVGGVAGKTTDSAVTSLLTNPKYADAFWGQIKNKVVTNIAKSAVVGLADTAADNLTDTAMAKITGTETRTAQDIVTDFGVTLLFGMGRALIDAKATTQDNKLYIENAVEGYVRDYEALNTAAKKSGSAEGVAEIGEALIRRGENLKAYLNNNIFTGAQDLVDSVTEKIDYVNGEVKKKITQVKTEYSAESPKAKADTNAPEAVGSALPIYTKDGSAVSTKKTDVKANVSGELGEIADSEPIAVFTPETASNEIKKLENILIAKGADDISRKEIIDTAVEIEKTLDGSDKNIRSVFNDMSKITSTAISKIQSRVGPSDAYWILFSENFKTIPTGNAKENINLVTEYSNAYTKALKNNNPEKYNAVMLSADGQDLSAELPKTVLRNNIPNTVQNAGQYRLVATQIKNIINAANIQIESERNEIYGEISVASVENDVEAAEVQTVTEPKNITLTRMGDFYEAFGDEATELAEKLNLTPAYKTVNGIRTAMVGFPVHILEKYQNALGNEYKFVISKSSADTSVNDTPLLKNQSVSDKITQNNDGFLSENKTAQKTMYAIMEDLGLTYDEQRAILEYKSSGSYRLNEMLYTKRVLSNDKKAFLDNILNALKKFPIYKGAVYRNLVFDWKGQKALDNFIAQHKQGEIIQYGALTSSSKFPDRYSLDGELLVHMTIQSNSGIDLSNIGAEEEQEVLFAPNTTFYIRDIQYNGKTANIYLEERVSNGLDKYTRTSEIQNNGQYNGRTDKYGKQLEHKRFDESIAGSSDIVRGRGTDADSISESQSKRFGRTDGTNRVRDNTYYEPKIGVDGQTEGYAIRSLSAETSEKTVKDNRVNPADRNERTQYTVMQDLGLTYDEQHAILEYKSSGSYKLNALLRNGETLTAEQVNFKNHLLKALEHFPKFEGTVYRNIGFKKATQFESFIRDCSANPIIRFKDFTSASKIENRYTISDDMPYKVYYKIETEEGFDISDIGLTDEAEVVFMPGTDFFVSDMSYDNTAIYIKMKEVNNHVKSRFEGNNNDTGAMLGMGKASNEHAFFRGNERFSDTLDSIQRGIPQRNSVVATEPENIGGNVERSSVQYSGELRQQNRNEPRIQGVLERGNVTENTDTVYTKKDVADRDSVSRWTTERAEGNEDRATNLADIVKSIRDKFGIPIATGKIASRNAAGIYKVQPEVIRTRIANNLPTVSHELGHHLDKKYDVSKLESVKELRKVVSKSFLKQYPENEKNGEAVAEFVRIYLKNTSDAAKLCPTFYADFTKCLSKSDLNALNGIAASVNAYLSSDISERYDAAIVSGQKKEKVPFKEKWHKWYTDWVDAFHPQKQAVDYVEEVTGQTLSGKNNAYILASNSRNAHTVANFLICEGFRDLDGNIVDAKSFIESIGMVSSDNVKLLDKYLVLRHSLEWIAPEQEDVTPKRVFADETLENVEEIKNQIAKIEEKHPEIKTAAENLYEYQNNVIKHFVIPAGGMTEDMLSTLNRKYPSYVPFYRAVGKKSRSAKGTFANQRVPIMRAKGSGDLIISPTESIIRNTEKMVKFAMRNRVMGMWADYADTVDGFGQFMEKVEPDRIPHFTDITSQKEQFTDALPLTVSNAKDYWTVSDLFDTIFGDTVADFTPVANANKKIVTVMRNGKTEYYQIHDDAFYKSVAELSPQQTSGLLKISTAVMNSMKSLITQNNPIFAITNAIRDFETAYKLSEINNPATFVHAYIKALSGIIANSEGYKQYKAMGGGHSSELSANVENISQTLRKVAQKDMGKALRLAHSIFRHPVETVAAINDIVESTPRFMEFMRTLESGGDLQEAIYNAEDITTNFKKSGSGATAKAVNKIVMFNNASIQGLDKTARTITAKNPKKRHKTWLKFILVALIGGFIQHFWNTKVDKEGYENLSSYKKNNFRNFAIGNGKFISFPKERENAVLDSLVERTLEKISGNREAFYDLGGYIASQLLPPMLPDTLNPKDALHSVLGSTVLGGLADIGFNRDFKGAPIESDYDKDLPSHERYNENTSKLAYALGQTKLARDLDMSPKEIDHLISSYTGILGQINTALFPMNDSRRDTSIGLRNKFISDSNYSTDVLNRIYENRKNAENAFKFESTVDTAVEYEKNGVIASYIAGMNKAVKALPEGEQRNGRVYLLKTLNSWNYENSAAQSDMLTNLDGSTVNKDAIFTELPSSTLEWTVNKQKYVYQMTPQEYHKYISDYMAAIENARRYYGRSTVESYEAAKESAKKYMSDYKNNVLKRQYFDKATAKTK